MFKSEFAAKLESTIGYPIMHGVIYAASNPSLLVDSIHSFTKLEEVSQS